MLKIDSVTVKNIRKEKIEAEKKIQESISKICEDFTRKTGYSIYTVWIGFADVTTIDSAVKQHVVSNSACEVDLSL